MNCPHCQAPNADDARFCGTCGRATSATEPASEPDSGDLPVLIGREIAGRYRIKAKLGEGGMGAVFKAEQISLKRTVAVKLLRPEVASSALLLRRFNAEAEAVAKLSHPNTVNIYDFGQDSDGTLFIAMEYIEGESLRHVIHREAPFSLQRALSIGLQVSSSLTDAHSRSIIHRDLKPDNVMLQQRGRERDIVRVLDFGIAKLRDENRQSQMAMTQAGDMLGTPQYMAPEQIRAETIDGRTDVYALGCLLYEMVTARLPYEAPTIMSLLSKHLIEPTVPPSSRRPDLGLPRAIDHLILAAMAKDPNARPATMEVFGEQIAALIATLPVDTTQSTAQRPAPSTAVAAIVSPAPVASTYGADVPQAPAFGPPPSSGGYVPPPSGAPPYDPRAAPPQPAARHERGGGSNHVLWIVLGVVVLAVGGVGVFLAQRSSSAKDPVADSSGSGSGPGPSASGPGQGSQVHPADAAQATSSDPWGGGSGAVPSNDDVDDDTIDDAIVDAPPDDEPLPNKGAKGLPPECEKLAKMYERLGNCNIVPVESRTQMKQAAKQFRAGLGASMGPAMQAQIASSCVTGASSIEQVLTMYGCP